MNTIYLEGLNINSVEEARAFESWCRCNYKLDVIHYLRSGDTLVGVGKSNLSSDIYENDIVSSWNNR